MDRRTMIKTTAGAAAVAGAGPAGASWAAAPPGPSDWQALNVRIGGRLIRVDSPLEAAARAGGARAEALFAQIKNPYYLGDEPALTQTLGWTDAWTSQASSHAVVAESVADVVAAVNFARAHRCRLVVKGGGHSYFGNSNAAGSLLVWTRRMRSIVLHDAFIPTGSPTGTIAVPAVSIGAGAMWGQVYNEVSVKGGRYVQGGGCLTVGVAGLVQGGGFGSFSKAYGTGAANLLEAEVVTADGRVRIASRNSEPELFFALKGGGGGTFGIVTRVTLRTHELPATIGAVLFSVTAKSDAAWRALVARVIDFYASALHNPEWGEQLRFSSGRKLDVSMLFRGLDRDSAQAVWQPLLAWIAQRQKDYAMAAEPLVLAIPARRFWDPALLRTVPGIVLADGRPGASPDSIYWATNLSEAGQVLHAYDSVWMPARLLERSRQSSLVDALVAASDEWSVTLHTNKGLAGGDPNALAAARDTATNPKMLDAFALLICAADGPPAWPGIPGHEPDLTAGRRQAAGVARAMAPIHALVPDAGRYMSETNFFGADWKRAYWGDHYPRLARAKRQYDPTGLFVGHHCVE